MNHALDALHTTIPAKPQRPNKMQGALLRLCSQGRPHCTLRRILGELVGPDQEDGRESEA